MKRNKGIQVGEAGWWEVDSSKWVRSVFFPLPGVKSVCVHFTVGDYLLVSNLWRGTSQETHGDLHMCICGLENTAAKAGIAYQATKWKECILGNTLTPILPEVYMSSPAFLTRELHSFISYKRIHFLVNNCLTGLSSGKGSTTSHFSISPPSCLFHFWLSGVIVFFNPLIVVKCMGIGIRLTWNRVLTLSFADTREALAVYWTN